VQLLLRDKLKEVNEKRPDNRPLSFWKHQKQKRLTFCDKSFKLEAESLEFLVLAGFTEQGHLSSNEKVQGATAFCAD
jgi:hypothetical protein